MFDLLGLLIDLCLPTLIIGIWLAWVSKCRRSIRFCFAVLSIVLFIAKISPHIPHGGSLIPVYGRFLGVGLALLIVVIGLETDTIGEEIWNRSRTMAGFLGRAILIMLVLAAPCVAFLLRLNMWIHAFCPPIECGEDHNPFDMAFFWFFSLVSGLLAIFVAGFAVWMLSGSLTTTSGRVATVLTSRFPHCQRKIGFFNLPLHGGASTCRSCGRAFRA